MDKNDNRHSGNYVRKVSGYEQKQKPRKRKRVAQKKKTGADGSFEQNRRYNQKQKRQRLRMKRIRALIILFVLLVLVMLLVLMTPVFNISSITVEGNNIVTLEEIDAKVHDISGQNLFRISSGNIKKRLSTIPYLYEAQVTKRIYPPSVKISVTECVPAGFIIVNGYEVIVDSSMKVLGSDNRYSTDNIPEIKGIDCGSYTNGKTLDTGDAEKNEAARTCLSAMARAEILSDVNYIDFSNITGIKFRYNNRIDAICGTHLDLDKKIRFFKETVTNNSIAENARGTIDLSVTGNAVYVP